MPKVTILMTSYNHADYIRESIESILTQTFTDFKLIIVDDCSTDDSFKIIKSFKDSRITAIKNPRNMGPEYAFSILHQKAKSEYVAIADSDNVWEKDKLEKQVNFLDKNPKYAAVFSRASFIDENSAPYSGENLYLNVFNVKNRSRYEWLNHFFHKGNCLCHPSLLIRRRVYKECGMVVNGLWQVPDFYKWIRLCLKHDFYILDEPLLKFRLHKNNISGDSNPSSFIRSSNEYYQIFDLFYNIPEKDFLKVFKEAKKYYINNKINTKFALSKLLLEKDHPASRTLALNKLFELLNNPENRSEIYKLYKYDDVSYKLDETTYAPFKASLPIYTARLYLYFNNNLDKATELSVDYFFQTNYIFTLNFDLSPYLKNKKLTAIRFDPINAPIKISLAIKNQDNIKINPIANHYLLPADRYAKDGEDDLFYTNTPSYIIENPPLPTKNLTFFIKATLLQPEDIVFYKNLEQMSLKNNLKSIKSNLIRKKNNLTKKLKR